MYKFICIFAFPNMAPSRLVYRYHISEDEIFMDTAIRTSFLKNCWFYFSNGMEESFLYCVGLRYETVQFFFFWAGTNFSEQKLKVSPKIGTHLPGYKSS